jgi:hypothetical protein
MSFCTWFKYLGTFFVPELSDMADITQRISQARRLFNSMNRQVFSNKKIRIDICRRLYEAIVVNIALWGCESWALEEENRAKYVSPQLSLQDMRVDDVGHSGETDHERRDQKNCRELTHNGIDNGNAKMPMALQTQCDGGVKIPEANAWRMVFNTTSGRETAADHTPRLHNHPRVVLKEKKGN